MFGKVLVANRGEIAIRVMRACRELGVETVAVYSDADRHARHVTYADEAYNVGPPRAADSYLDAEAILDAARRSGVDAIHPGYGFLAESASFARSVEEAGLGWVGPPSEAMERLGGKTSARRLMGEAGVPVVPGTTEPVDSAQRVVELGEEFGWPVAVKAVGGGGGRGLKVVSDPDGAEEAFEAARREGEAYFSNPSVYVEKYLDGPRHIEVQVLADGEGTVRHLGERDCSLQRRHQKVIEEAPSPALDDELSETIREAAVRGVREAGYENAGTVEFLVADGECYFMEVNTRIQVEHTVTEAVTGIDVVKWQLRIAAGQRVDFDQADVRVSGHAIEYRINAENPANRFAPTPGTLTTYAPPGGIGIRIDDGVRQGDEIGGDYDSLVAKLVVHAADREECLARSRRALGEYEIGGVHSTIPFHRLMLEDEVFLAAEHTTDYLDEHLDPARIAEAVERWGPGEVGGSHGPGSVERTYTVEVDGRRFEVDVEERRTPGGGRRARQPTSGGSTRASAATDDKTVIADMHGTVLEVAVAVGDEMEPGDLLCIVEAMKMENDIVATRGGTVAEVRVSEGQRVSAGDVLVVLD